MDVKTATDFELTHALRNTALIHMEGPINPRFAEAKESLRAIASELLERFRAYLRTAKTPHDKQQAALGIRLMTNRLAEL